MGLLIEATQEKPIIISGTDIQLPSVYCRIEFAGRKDGITLEIGSLIYASKQAYLEGKIIYTNVDNQPFAVELLAGETQDINTALNYTKVYFDNLGYNTTIDIN
jgi:hypothetical protein